LGERVENEVGNMAQIRAPRRSAKRLILELLLKLDEKREYSYMELMRYFIRNGVPISAAEYYMKYLPDMGALERVERGVYRLNKKVIKKLLEELEH
jgi:DNA-binding transcriptional ArsR family regulator